MTMINGEKMNGVPASEGVKIVNLTPHDVNIVREDGTVETHKSQGVARATMIPELVEYVNGIPVYRVTVTGFVDLPDPKPGVRLIVSKTTADAAKEFGRGSDDLIITYDTVRDENNRICGCKSWSVV